MQPSEFVSGAASYKQSQYFGSSRASNKSIPGSSQGKSKYTLAPLTNASPINDKPLNPQRPLPPIPQNQRLPSYLPPPQNANEDLSKALVPQPQQNNRNQQQNGQEAPQNNLVPYKYSSGEMRVLQPAQFANFQANQIANPQAQRMVMRYAGTQLESIKSVDEVIIDHTLVLAIKRGDLSIIQGEVFKCTPRQPNLMGIPLVLKRIDCVDRRIYDMKVYEFDIFMRYKHHPNLITLHQYWSEKSPSPYQYKSLVGLFDEGTCGDMLKSVVLNPVRPSSRLCMKYFCEIAKGLQVLHNANVVHGSVKPSSIYIMADNTAVLGELGKIELDAARHTHQLFSKVLIQDAMPHTLIYWAPEVMSLQRYSTAADMWSFGITMYQVVTGEHPFDTSEETIFREEVTSARLDVSRLMAHSERVRIAIQNLIRVDPSTRWDANQVLAYCQYDFIVDIQRLWRGYKARKGFRRRTTGLVKIQATMRGFVTRKRVLKRKVNRKDDAVIRIQSRFRAFKQRKLFLRQKNAIMKCQANVLTRQFRRAYLEMLQNTLTAQAYIKRMVAMQWFQGVKKSKDSLESHVANINQAIQQLGTDANSFANQFPGGEVSKNFQNLTNYEQQIARALPGQQAAQFAQQNQPFQNNTTQQQPVSGQDAELKAKLGDKYDELNDMVDQLKSNLIRVAEQSKLAQPLSIRMQHPYTYSKWDSINDPFNVVENVLKDDNTVYKGLSPQFDFTLADGQIAFISEVIIWPGSDTGPQKVNLYVGNTIDQWAFVKEYLCSKQGATRCTIPGEYQSRYLRVECQQNTRGGNIVTTRFILVKGIVQNGQDVPVSQI